MGLRPLKNFLQRKDKKKTGKAKDSLESNDKGNMVKQNIGNIGQTMLHFIIRLRVE